MRLAAVSQLFSLRDLRNAALGVTVIVGGLGLAGLTLYAHQTGNIRLAGISAGISLVFVLLILIFVVPPLARNAGREASQMNLPFELTPGGAIMIGLLVIVGFSAWNTGNNLLFLVLSFMIGAMVVAFFAGSLSLKKLDVTMRFPESIVTGEPTLILVTLRNRKRWLSAFSIVVEVRGRERERSVAAPDLDALLPRWIASRLGRAPVVRRTLHHFVHIPARESAESRVEHVFPRRGRLLIQDFELSTKFPFGFFRHRRRLPAREAELIVFPKPAEIGLALDSLPVGSGPRTSAKRGLGQDLLALREYRTQDDPRRIDWKATARSQLLIVREFAAEDEKRVTVSLDTRMPATEMPRASIRDIMAAEQSGKAADDSPRFESGASLAAALLIKFELEKAEFRLVIHGEASDLATGRDHLHAQLRRLAVAEATIHSVAGPADTADYIDDSHHFLVTANGPEGLESELPPTLKIIKF
ncbi:MAG: DUF58 domain-containing protein [Pyrinomonadaceae bacterium]